MMRGGSCFSLESSTFLLYWRDLWGQDGARVMEEGWLLSPGEPVSRLIMPAKTSVLTQQRAGFGGAVDLMDTDGMVGSRDMLVVQCRSPVVGTTP